MAEIKNGRKESCRMWYIFPIFKGLKNSFNSRFYAINSFDEKDYPITPKTVFYDYIYINALLENPGLAEALSDYRAFTDIEFNPEKSLNCQAKACAVFVSLSNLGLIDRARDFDSFFELCSKASPAAPVKP